MANMADSLSKKPNNANACFKNKRTLGIPVAINS